MNRNFGLQMATGDIVGFPDDDCIYYPDTLNNILSFFLDPEFKCYDAVLGQIYDNNNHQPLIKNWPQKKSKVTKYNFYKHYIFLIKLSVLAKCLFLEKKLGQNSRMQKYYLLFYF